MDKKTLLKKAIELNIEAKYDEVNLLLTYSILEQFNIADLYAEKALALWRIKQYNDFEHIVNKGFTIDPNNEKIINFLGNIHFRKGEYDDAIECFKKAIMINKDYSSPYNSLGAIYNERNENKDAVENFETAIEKDPKNYIAFYNLGIFYKKINDIDKAVKSYDNSISINPDYASSYNNLGNILYSKGEYKKAKGNFEKYLELANDPGDYISKIAQSKIEEIDKILHSPSYKTANQIVSKIKELLLFTGEYVTHYTSISTVQILVLNESPMRLSEGSFLNDTSEGEELFKFLEYSVITNKIKHEEIFTKRPFIGSFVDSEKNNDLTLWRMYGKEALEEAKGCSITINAWELKKKIKKQVNPKDARAFKNTDGIEFYRVAYHYNSKFEFAGADDQTNSKLTGLMKDLKKEIEKFIHKKSKTKNEEIEIIELLNSIAYLFKSVEYKYENEIRLVIKDAIGFGKLVDFEKKDFKPSTNPNKVYIELVPISSLLKTITIGPKVAKGEEWASTFHYHLMNNKIDPEIHISKIPFK